MEIREKQLGRDHPERRRQPEQPGEPCTATMGRYAGAEPLFRRSLEIREKQLGPDHPNVADSLNNLAILYDRMGRYADAEPLVQTKPGDL